MADPGRSRVVRRPRSPRFGRDVPIITVPQGFDEAFPAVVRWVKTQGRIEIGVEGGQGFVVRALDDGGMVFEGKGGQSVGEALTALQRRIAQADRPVKKATKSAAAAQRQPSRGRGG